MAMENGPNSPERKQHLYTYSTNTKNNLKMELYQLILQRDIFLNHGEPNIHFYMSEKVQLKVFLNLNGYVVFAMHISQHMQG